MKRTRIIIAEENEVINNQIRSILQQYEDIEIIGCCFSAKQEIEMIDKLKPDIVITNLVKRGKLSGMDIIRKYKTKGDNIKFLVITGSDEIDYSIVDGVIKKPFINMNIIYKEIKKII